MIPLCSDLLTGCNCGCNTAISKFNVSWTVLKQQSLQSKWQLTKWKSVLRPSGVNSLVSQLLRRQFAMKTDYQMI